jgi:hypothetical protein
VKQLLNDDSDFISAPFVQMIEEPFAELTAKKKTPLLAADDKQKIAVKKPVKSHEPANGKKPDHKPLEREKSLKKKPSKTAKPSAAVTNLVDGDFDYTAESASEAEHHHDIRSDTTSHGHESAAENAHHSIERHGSKKKSNQLIKKRQSSLSKKPDHAAEKAKQSIGHKTAAMTSDTDQEDGVITDSTNNNDHIKDSPSMIADGTRKDMNHKIVPVPVNKPVHYDSKQAASIVADLPEFRMLSRKLSDKKFVQKAPTSNVEAKVTHKRDSSFDSKKRGDKPAKSILDTFLREKSFSTKAEPANEKVHQRTTSIFHDDDKLLRRNSSINSKKGGKQKEAADKTLEREDSKLSKGLKRENSDQSKGIKRIDSDKFKGLKREDSGSSSIRRNASIFRDPEPSDSEVEGVKKVVLRTSKASSVASSDIDDTPLPPPPPRHIEVPKDIKHNFQMATSLYGTSIKRKSSLSKKLVKKKSSIRPAAHDKKNSVSKHSDSDNESTTSSRISAACKKSSGAKWSAAAEANDKLHLPKLEPIKSEYILESFAITDKDDYTSPEQSPQTLKRLPSIKRRDGQNTSPEQSPRPLNRLPSIKRHDSQRNGAKDIVAAPPPPMHSSRNVEVPRTTKDLVRLASTVYSASPLPLKKKKSIKKKK